MRILTRYVLFDLLKVFLLTLSGLTLLIFVFMIGKEAIDKGVGLKPLIRIAPYLLPQALQFAVPGTILLAATSVYGRIASYNEVIAIKALGISPMVLIWPTFVLATFVSFVAVVLNDLAVSWGRNGAARVVVESLEEIAYGQLRTKHAFNMGKYNVTVRAVDGRRLILPTLIVQGTNGGRATTITAEEAELQLLLDQDKVLIRFLNAEADLPQITAAIPEKFEQLIPLDEFDMSSSKNRSPSNYALAEIGPAIKEQEERITRIEDSLVAQSAFGLMVGDYDSLSSDAWKVNEKEIESAQVRLHRLRTEPWRRWANGFSCLCFVLVGVPVAIWMKQSDFLASFFICFLPILLVYYPLLAVSVDQAKDGTFPPESVWVGNFLLSLAGLWLLRRVNRY
jgi:lipopolysaccharide export system permease protein